MYSPELVQSDERTNAWDDGARQFPHSMSSFRFSYIYIYIRNTRYYTIEEEEERRSAETDGQLYILLLVLSPVTNCLLCYSCVPVEDIIMLKLSCVVNLCSLFLVSNSHRQ